MLLTKRRGSTELDGGVGSSVGALEEAAHLVRMGIRMMMMTLTVMILIMTMIRIMRMIMMVMRKACIAHLTTGSW